MTYINLTPHPVVIMPECGGYPDTVGVSGTIARIVETTAADGVTVVELGEVVGLPDPDPDVICIVSMPLAMALAAKGIDRRDVVYPYGQVRDGQGRILGYRTLARLRSAT
jgi:hypothetical protein